MLTAYIVIVSEEVSAACIHTMFSVNHVHSLYSYYLGWLLQHPITRCLIIMLTAYIVIITVKVNGPFVTPCLLMAMLTVYIVIISGEVSAASFVS